MKKVNLTQECIRLKNAKLKSIARTDDSDKFKVSSLSRDEKIEYLAMGVIEGWYGNNIVQEAILGDLYEEVRTKVYDILNKGE